MICGAGLIHGEHAAGETRRYGASGALLAVEPCFRQLAAAQGTPAAGEPITIGLLEIISNRPISVTAVYTVRDAKSGSVSIDVQQIPGQRGR